LISLDSGMEWGVGENGKNTTMPRKIVVDRGAGRRREQKNEAPAKVVPRRGGEGKERRVGEIREGI